MEVQIGQHAPPSSFNAVLNKLLKPRLHRVIVQEIV
jgi:hypothetical protein